MNSPTGRNAPSGGATPAPTGSATPAPTGGAMPAPGGGAATGRGAVRQGYSTAVLLGAAVAFLGGAFLFNWYLNELRRMMPTGGFVPMQYNTALGFVVTGLAVVAHCLGRTRIAFFAGALAAGLGSLSLAEGLLGRSLHVVDALFGGHFAGDGVSDMSVNTSLCFALTGALLVTWRTPGARRRWRTAVIGALAAGVVAVGFIGLLGYVTHDGSTYGWARLSAMEAHTALGFVALGTAFFVMLMRMKDAPVVGTLPGWSAWAVGLGVAVLTLTLWTSLTASDARTNQLAETRLHSAALSHTNQVVQSHLRSLKRLSLRCQGDGRVRAENFRDDARTLLGETPGLTSVAFVDPHGNVLGAQGRHDDRALELAIGERQELHAALRSAKSDRLAASSDPVSLYGPTTDLFVFVPVWVRDTYRGSLVFEHDLHPFLDWIFGDGVGRTYDVNLSTLNGQPFYSRRGGASAKQEPRAAASAGATGEHAKEWGAGQIGFADRIWVMGSVADGTVVGGKNVSNTLILWFGMFLAVALAFVIRKSGLVRQRALSLAEANRTIEERSRSLREANASLRATEAELTRAAREQRRVLDSLSAMLIGVDDQGRVVEWNSVACALFGLTDAQVLGQPFAGLSLCWDRDVVRDAVAESLASGERVRRENIAVQPPPEAGAAGGALDQAAPAGPAPGSAAGEAPSGAELERNRVVSITVNPTQAEGGRGFAIIGSDVTERQLLEMQLHQAQKLESVGTLAAGIAHEINTPMQFVSDNLRFVSQSVTPLTAVLQLIPEIVDGSRSGTVPPDLVARLDLATAGVDVAFLADELPAALGEMQEGVLRVTTIVRAMKDFSHPGNQGRQSADLNKAISTTLSVARNEYKYHADVETDFGEIPLADCYVADLNQVFLNLLVNAAHAIKDVVGDGGGRGTIRISTRLDGDTIEIRVSDTGAGIPEHVRDKIFDQFFTTKAVGKGTGLGLAIARAVVIDKHKGSIRFESEVGRGTTFIVRIPVAAQPDEITPHFVPDRAEPSDLAIPGAPVGALPVPAAAADACERAATDTCERAAADARGRPAADACERAAADARGRAAPVADGEPADHADHGACLTLPATGAPRA
jgi:signal transduction histidine kinase